MQRDCRTSNPPADDSVTACVRAQPVRSPEPSAIRNPGDSNGHTGPLAATKTEAHISRRSREGGSDMLRVSHIPANGIRAKTVSTSVSQREAQISPWAELF